MMSIEASLETLKGLFSDKPEALTVFDLKGISSEYLKGKIRNEKLFASPVNLWVTGRTNIGKTSLGNSLLDSKVMKSTGHIDCTDFIGFFKLGDNLRFFDVPGYASDGNYENINRVGLLIPQTENEFSDPPTVIMRPTESFLVKDFSNCANPKDKPEEERVTVEGWQSDDNQQDVGPDVIVYVHAPHANFLQPDSQYLGQLLKTWKSLRGKCIVIPALNIFERNGRVLPSKENMDDARNKITKIYQTVFKNEWFPPIVEINALQGTGIEQLTDLVCQVLPQDKIGNMQQVLKEDLKQFAEKEHVARYYRTLSLIAGRLSRHTVDKKLEGENLFMAAASAISAYGVMTFKGAEAVTQIKGQMNAVVEEVERIERSQQKEITQKENVMGTKDITRVKPKVEQKEVEYDVQRVEYEERVESETIYVPTPEKVTREIQTTVPVSKEKKVKRGGLGILDWFDGGKTVTYTDHETRTLRQDEMVLRSEERTITKTRSLPKIVTETKKRIEERIVGYEEEVIDTVQVVVAQVDKVVGTEYLKGGYPAIEFLLQLGLGVQHFCNPQTSTPNWNASMQFGKMQAERKLMPVKGKIEHLVNDPSGEQPLVQLLEKVLAN